MFLKKLTRYDLMDSQQIDDGGGIEWPDCLSIDLEDSEQTTPSREVMLTDVDVLRPDLFFYTKLGTNNLEDMLLWLNDIPSRRMMEPGMIIKIPSKTDLNNFYLRNRK